MRSSTLILIISLGFVLLALMATNPSLSDHKEAVAQFAKSNINSTTVEQNLFTDKARSLALGLVMQAINNAVTRDNYLIFSTTKVYFAGKENIIGFGMLGYVKLFDLSNKQLPWQKDQILNDNFSEIQKDTKSSRKKSKIQTPEEFPDYGDAVYEKGYYIPNGSESHRVYFHNGPDPYTRRNAFLVTDDMVYVEKIVNGFGYVVFTNDRGQTTKGWLLMSELKPTTY